MKNTKRKLKTMALMVAMAAGMLLPMKVSAQGLFNSSFGHSGSGGVSNGAFGNSGSTEVTNESFGTNSGDVKNQNFGKAPLGSGLLIMLVAGAGYATLKRKRVKRGV